MFQHQTRFLTLFFIIVFFLTLSAQIPQFNVEYYKTEGKLSRDDLVKIDFGRYDGYEINLNEGEAFNIFVYSEDFTPSLVLVTPSEKVYLQAQADNENFAVLNGAIPESGEWILFVVGDESESGVYLLQYGFAGKDALQLDDGADFCTMLGFLISHSKANFIFLDSQFSKLGDVKLPRAIDSFIDGNDASYYSVMYTGDDNIEAERIFNSSSTQINNCLGQQYTVKSIDWYDVEGYREKYLSFKKSEKEKIPAVKILYSDFSNLIDESQYRYEIDVVIR